MLKIERRFSSDEPARDIQPFHYKLCPWPKAVSMVISIRYPLCFGIPKDCAAPTPAVSPSNCIYRPLNSSPNGGKPRNRVSMLGLPVFVALSLVSSQVLAHGLVKVPQARVIGTAMEASCGYAPWLNLKNDPYGPIETALALAGADMQADCDMWFCKGYKFEDNTGNVQSFQVGQVVNMKADIENFHPGFANVSILSTTTKKKIAGPLISWPLWGVTGYPWPDDLSNWNITIPDVGTQCVTPGACVVMWFWYSPKNNATYPNGTNQTYQSCIDFVVPAPSVSSTIRTTITTSSSSTTTTKVSTTTSKATSATTTSIATTSK